MSNLITAQIRTWVPIGVGVLLTWLSTVAGVDYNSPELAAGITGLVAAVYYSAVRYAAERFPAVGWLLGVNKAPGY